MRYYLLALAGLTQMALADITDLEQYVAELNQRSQVLPLPVIPAYQPVNTNYNSLNGKNIFSQVRGNQATTPGHSERYLLSQLQMVGFMEYNKVNYAFLKTPFETIRVKVGEKIQNGVVVQIDSKSAEIDELQTQHGKKFIKKIFLQLRLTNDKKVN